MYIMTEYGGRITRGAEEKHRQMFTKKPQNDLNLTLLRETKDWFPTASSALVTFLCVLSTYYPSSGQGEMSMGEAYRVIRTT